MVVPPPRTASGPVIFATSAVALGRREATLESSVRPSRPSTVVWQWNEGQAYRRIVPFPFCRVDRERCFRLILRFRFMDEKNAPSHVPCSTAAGDRGEVGGIDPGPV